MLDRIRRVFDELRSGFSFGYPAMKVARLHGRALRLEKAGKPREAFEATRRALECLPTSTESKTDMAVPVRLVVTVLFAELATRIGSPRAADDMITQALTLSSGCQDDPKIREYVVWLRYRLHSDG